MNIFITVNKDWSINKNCNFTKKLKENNNFFKQITNNKVVIYDDNFIVDKPKEAFLRNKICVRYSPNSIERNEEIINDFKKLFEKLSFYNKDNVFVLGGEELQKQLLCYCQKAYITKIENVINSESFFEDLDKNSNWVLSKTSNPLFEDGIVYYFCEYVNKNPLKFNYWEDDNNEI